MEQWTIEEYYAEKAKANRLLCKTLLNSTEKDPIIFTDRQQKLLMSQLSRNRDGLGIPETNRTTIADKVEVNSREQSLEVAVMTQQ